MSANDELDAVFAPALSGDAASLNAPARIVIAQTGRPTHPDQNPVAGFLTATFSDPVSAFTLALVVSTVLLWRATLRIAEDTKQAGKIQADKMERSVAEASRAAAAMEDVSKSMAINADQIVRSVDLQKRYGQMQLRPYLTVLLGEGVWQDENNVFEIRPKVLNTGHTPAKDVRWRIGIGIVRGADLESFRFPLPERPPKVGGNMIAPHQDYVLGAMLDHRLPEAEAEDITLGRGDQALLVWGCVSYRDGLKRRYLTTFAQKVWWLHAKDADGKIDKAFMQVRFLYQHNRAN